jgi:hypothetical protein
MGSLRALAEVRSLSPCKPFGAPAPLQCSVVVHLNSSERVGNAHRLRQTAGSQRWLPNTVLAASLSRSALRTGEGLNVRSC